MTATQTAHPVIVNGLPAYSQSIAFRRENLRRHLPKNQAAEVLGIYDERTGRISAFNMATAPGLGDRLSDQLDGIDPETLIRFDMVESFERQCPWTIVGITEEVR